MFARSPVDPLRTLVVADDDEDGRAVAARLGAEFAAGLAICDQPEQAHVHVQSHRPHVVVLALASLQAVDMASRFCSLPRRLGRRRPPRT